MRKEPKTRFALDVGSGRCEVFSVLQRPNGELQIFLPKALNFEEGDNLAKAQVINEKISIHLSEQSHGTTIKLTTDLSDGQKFTQAAFIESSSEEILYPVFGSTIVKFIEQRYKIRGREVDKFIEFPPMDETEQTFVYLLFVTSKNVKMENFLECPFDLVESQHEKFNICIYFGYISHPAMPWSVNVALPTSPPQYNKVPTRPNGLGRSSFSLHEAEKFIDFCAQNLLTNNIKQAKKYCRIFQIEFDEEKWHQALLVTHRPYKYYEIMNQSNPIVTVVSPPIRSGALGLVARVNGKKCGKLYFE